MSFITPLGVEGCFIPVFSNAANAAADPKAFLLDYLRLFMRDDIISWSLTQQQALQNKDGKREAPISVPAQKVSELFVVCLFVCLFVVVS